MVDIARLFAELCEAALPFDLQNWSPVFAELQWLYSCVMQVMMLAPSN